MPDPSNDGRGSDNRAGPERDGVARLPTRSVPRSRPGAPWWKYEGPREPSALRGRVGAPGRVNGVSPEPPAAAPAEEPPAPPDEQDGADSPVGVPADPTPITREGSSAIALAVAIASLATVVLAAHTIDAPRLGRVLLPVFGISAALAAGPYLVRRHPEEPWLARVLFWGMVAKIVATFLRYYSLVDSYGKVGDATEYDQYGRAYVAGTAKPLTDLHKTNFIRWFTAMVYVHFGVDIVVGFLVFGLIAFVGSYLWYRATVEAVPFLDKRLYALLVFFAPSVVFWPASIGKEALMQFAMGLTALGGAYVLTSRFVKGLVVAAPGGWLLWLVRPHLLAFMTAGFALAYIVGRSPGRQEGRGPSLVKPLGMVVVAFLAIFAATQAASWLGMPNLSLKSINQELADQTQKSHQGGSKFETSSSNLTPLSPAKGLVTVLLRPFPWEVDTGNQILASLEGVALLGYMIHRRQSLLASVRQSRAAPYLFFCIVLTLVYATAFASFANAGLLVRQRSLVLPALYVLIAVDPILAARFRRGAAADAPMPVDAPPPALVAG